MTAVSELVETLVEGALQVLNEPDPFEKARLGEVIATRWLQGQIRVPYHGEEDTPPDRPARLSTVKLLPSNRMPKLGKCGSLRSRQAIVHSLVHTESWAIDLSWDIIARFGKKESMPVDFFNDFVKVAQDEGRHFTLLNSRLQEIGSFYGSLPAHDGLWDSAICTSDQLLARLAIEHCVHEARGIDVLPTTISRFRNGGDDCTADLLEQVVYPEEITHCAAGIKWFKFLCLRMPCGSATSIPCLTSFRSTEMGQDVQKFIDSSRNDVEPMSIQVRSCMDQAEDEIIQQFHTIVRKYFRGVLKPPFNKQARNSAGFGPEWYEPLAIK